MFVLLGSFSLFLATWPVDALVLVAELEPEAKNLEFEASPSNWNQALNDAGQGQFEGEIFFDEEDGTGCKKLLNGQPSAGVEGRILLLAAPPDRWSSDVGAGPFYEEALQKEEETRSEEGDGGRQSESDCQASFAELTTAAAAGGAIAVVFVQRGDRLGGISLGDYEAPPIRAVLVEPSAGLELLFALRNRPRLRAHLAQGKLIAQDAYEEQFIFRVDEIASTRAVNFLWHTHPGMLRTAGGLTLSEKLFQQQVELPQGWFSSTPTFIPLFNPSLAALPDGTLLASLRMSNGPGCPSLRKMRETSMETRIFRNELVLAQLDPNDLSPIRHTIVEMPPLICTFSEETNMSGRKFLDEVSGPMDVRLRASDDNEEVWIVFYAERNLRDGEVMRGINAAPLKLEFGDCGSSGAGQSEAEGRTEDTPKWGFVGPSDTAPRCSSRGHATKSLTLHECQVACEELQLTEEGQEGSCNAITIGPRGECIFSYCDSEPKFAPQVEGTWQVWQLEGAEAPLVWGEGAFTCGWLTSSRLTSLEDCQRHCESQGGPTTAKCDSIVYSEEGRICYLQKCRRKDREAKREVPRGWIIMHRTRKDPSSTSSSSRSSPQRCLQRARVDEQDVIIFPAANGVEKNWNIISLTKDRIIIEYHVDPHIVLQANLFTSPSGPRHMVSFEQLTVTRWPYEVIHGLTNVRGGFCCMPFENGEGLGGFPKGHFLLGVGHLQRIRTPFDQASGDINRFRRQASSRTYHQFFYVLRPEYPYDVMGVSTEFCITMNGHFSNHWKSVLADDEEACEAIQFVAGLALKKDNKVVVGYGINDCEADLLEVSLEQILAMVRPVVSDLNVNPDDLEMI